MIESYRAPGFKHLEEGPRRSREATVMELDGKSFRVVDGDHLSIGKIEGDGGRSAEITITIGASAQIARQDVAISFALSPDVCDALVASMSKLAAEFRAKADVLAAAALRKAAGK